MPDLSKYTKEELKELINDGIAPCHLYVHKEIIDFVENEISMGVTKTQAVYNASQNFAMSERHIWDIVR